MNDVGKELKKDQLDRNNRIRSKIINSFDLSDEIFLKKYYCDRESLFQVCLPYFQSQIREKTEKKFISLYLYHSKKFMSLLKDQNIQKFINSLNYVSENIIYENYCRNKLIMRYGDKADNFYITLFGRVSIIIPIKLTMLLNLNEYQRYIALLLLYQEFEIVRLLLKENKSEFSLDIPDLSFILQYFDKNKKEKINIKIKKKGNKNRKSFIKNAQDLFKEDIFEKELINSFESFMKTNLTKEEYNKFINMKNNINFDSKHDEIISPEIYINRIKYFQKEKISDIDLLRRFCYLEKINEGKNDKKKLCIIYEYREIVQLEAGDTFGDLTMNGAASKRTATIISLTQSHFGCLNKKAFIVVKETSEKKRKEKINFLCRIKLFRSINVKTMTDKYFNLFAFKESGLDEYIIKRGEINNNIIIIKSGNYEIDFNGKIKDIFDLINHYRNNYNDNFTIKELKKYQLNDDLKKKINKLNENMNKILMLLNSEEFNYKYNFINKLFVANNLSIFGLKETEFKCINNNKELDIYSSFIDIKCKSIEGEYALIDKKIFYKQIYSSDHKIKDETKFFIKEFIENILNRLVSVLYCKIWNLLTKNEMKIYKYIRQTNIKEDDKTEGNNIITDMGLDINCMMNNDISNIERIINKLFKKYDDNAFNIKNANLNLFEFSENKNLVFNNKKNEIKFEKEKFNKIKFNSIINNIKYKQFKKNNNFKSIIGEGKIRLLKNIKIKEKLNLPKENNFIRNYSSKNINRINANINPINQHKKESKLFLIRKNMLTPKTLKIKLRKRTTSFGYENNKSYKTLIIQKHKNSDIFPRNSSNTNIHNSTIKKTDFDYNFKTPNSVSKLTMLGSIYSNYSRINNAKISKIDLSLVHNESMKENDSLLYFSPNIVNKIKKIGRPNSVKNTNNNSRESMFLDSTQISRESYMDKRKIYILKNTRSYFTRNKNLVLSKSVKKMEDKMV